MSSKYLNWDKLIIRDDNHLSIICGEVRFDGETPDSAHYINFDNHKSVCYKLFGKETTRDFEYPNIQRINLNGYWPVVYDTGITPVDFAIIHFKKYHKGKLIDLRKEF